MLEIKNVSTHYGRIPMLMDVSLNVAQGQVVCVLGANGAGKTTLLKTILSLVKPDRGSIIFNGQRIDSLPTHKIVEAGISIVSEGSGIFPRMSVENNLLMGAYYEKDKNVVQQRLEKIYHSFPVLKERLQQRAGTLSGGERTMLGIARGLIAGPKLLLMDEPSLGLAPVMVQETFEVVKRLNQEENLTILLIEQNAKKALSVSHRGYIMQKGQIILEGSQEELLNSSVVQSSYLKS